MMAGDVAATPTLDDLRALARSSPWLWRTLRFTLETRGRQTYGTDRLRAWVSRPHGLRVADVDGLSIEAGWWPRPDEGLTELTEEPTLRADGLLARRPEDWPGPYRYDDPMFTSYRWVAMLHPFELADGVARDDDGSQDGLWSPTLSPIDVVDGPREVDHLGRRAWEAEVVTTPAYAARCSCCPLLDGDQAAENLAAEGWAYASAGRPRPGGSGWTGGQACWCGWTRSAVPGPAPGRPAGRCGSRRWTNRCRDHSSVPPAVGDDRRPP